MRAVRADELAHWIGARIVGDAAAMLGPDVVIDSRLVTPGALFVALAGERSDGHTFAAGALRAGAAGCLVTRIPDRCPSGGPGVLLIVDEVQAALAALGHHLVAEAQQRQNDPLRVVGITGSSGKTSVKDLLSQLLRGHAPTVAPVGSFNNEIGVPLTATGVGADTRFLVSEMGARGPGHIRYLCGITAPDVAVVLNVGHAHVGMFGSADATAVAKGELVEALGRGRAAKTRVAVLNADDHRVAGMAARSDAPVLWFGLEHDPGGARATWATDLVADDLGRFGFTWHLRDGAVAVEHPIQLQVLGHHQVPNALAAAGAAAACGLSSDEIAAGLCAAQPLSHWRMEVTERHDHAVILNDAYNANPESMAAALETVAVVAARRAATRLAPVRIVLVVGDMLELGDDAQAAHVELGALAQRIGARLLVAVGEFGGAVAAGALAAGLPGSAIRVVQDKTVAAQVAAGEVRPGDVVLVKASRGIGLEEVAARLLDNEDRDDARQRGRGTSL